jgi:hypothetical protein
MLPLNRALLHGVLALPLVAGCADASSTEFPSDGRLDAALLDGSPLDAQVVTAPSFDAAPTPASTQAQGTDDGGFDGGGAAADGGFNASGSAADAGSNASGSAADAGFNASGSAADAAIPAAGGALLLQEARRILGAARSSQYAHTTYVDEATGTFDFDCSGFLDYAMSRALPAAFADLQHASVSRPLAADYEKFISGLGAGTARWQRLSRAAELAPGDIIAWLKPASIATSDTGHVMVVDGAPQAGATPGEWNVLVIDSATSGHGPTDTRTASGQGIGAGTIVLMVDANDAPTGYHWSTLSYSTPYTTPVALGRLP